MNRCKLTAEIGINHNGNIDIAKKLIDMACFAGCDYVKFQKRTINLVYTEEELNKPRESPWGDTFYDQKYGLEFGKERYDIIDKYCKEKNIDWFASPWDPLSVKFLVEYNLPYIKIPSAKITDFEVLYAVKETDIPVIISTGMSTKKEVDNCVNFLGDQIEYILACTSTYPTKEEEMNMSFIPTLKREYPKYKIGFSNHSPGIIYCAVAAALGAEMIEFHITIDRSMYGTDQASSIETEGVLKIVKYVRNLEKAMGDGHWHVFPSEEAIKKKLRGC
jgi:N-acetylneuraminate synthase